VHSLFLVKILYVCMYVYFNIPFLYQYIVTDHLFVVQALIVTELFHTFKNCYCIYHAVNPIGHIV